MANPHSGEFGEGVSFDIARPIYCIVVCAVRVRVGPVIAPDGDASIGRGYVNVIVTGELAAAGRTDGDV